MSSSASGKPAAFSPAFVGSWPDLGAIFLSQSHSFQFGFVLSLNLVPLLQYILWKVERNMLTVCKGLSNSQPRTGIMLQKPHITPVSEERRREGRRTNPGDGALQGRTPDVDSNRFWEEQVGDTCTHRHTAQRPAPRCVPRTLADTEL